MARTHSRPPPLRSEEAEEPQPEIDHDVDGPLCIVCETLQIDKYFFNSISHPIKLGLWRQIVQSQDSCNFCRLVVHCLAGSQHRVQPHERDQILLSNYPSWELGVEMSPYDRLKSEAFSNKFDLRSRANKSPHVAYRLIAYVKDEPTVGGCIQYLADGEPEGENRQFFGRVMDSERVDVILLRDWLAKCERYHEGNCEDHGIAGRRLPENLRLIDVRSRTIVRAPDPGGLHYLTLSYVWGQREMKEETGMKPAVLNRADIRRTATGVENTPLPRNLPQTIEDAIFLTESLGFRYLWVDALCIVQDDDYEDKRSHLRRMDAIYNCSTITIAAASGRHANSGIPGISRPRRLQYSESVKGVPLATMAPSFTNLENSPSQIWNTRGWTFQEKVLAKRLLLFTDFQVYFRCSEAVWTEEIVMETGRLSRSVQSRPGKYRWDADRPVPADTPKAKLLNFVIPEFNMIDQWNYLGKFPDYVAAVREYTSRTLSDPDDTLLAIDGILRTLRSDTGHFIFGLPERYFLPSLLWYPEPGSIHRRSFETMPSWTWAGWSSSKGVSYDILDVRHLRTVVIELRNLFTRLGNTLNDVVSNIVHSNSLSGSDYGSTSETSSTSPASTTSSQLTPYSQSHPVKKRNWSALSTKGKATANVASCFGWPLLTQDHTIQDVYLCANGAVSKLDSRAASALSALLEEDATAPDPSTPHHSSPKGESHHPSNQALKYKHPVLSLKTPVVQFVIGRCLRARPPSDPSEASIYEVVDPRGRCVGEAWTTRAHAQRGYTQPLDFATVSWGLGLSAAGVAAEWVPRWTVDAARLAGARALGDAVPLVRNAFHAPPAKTLAGRYGVRRGGVRAPAVVDCVAALLAAEKGAPRPRALWPTVNLILVEWDGPVARRIGVGRVVFDAWVVSRGPAEEIILA